MLKELRHAILFTVVTMILFGGAYPLVLWGIGRIAFADRADGSLIHRADASIAGSSLIAQAFTQPRYFHPRPSAVDYNAASTGGSNLAASNPDQVKALQERLTAQMQLNHASAEQVPVEMITASGGGLDPHIPTAAAELQIERIAAARHVNPDRLRDLVRAHIEPPTLGFLGRDRINVLVLNLALDQEIR